MWLHQRRSHDYDRRWKEYRLDNVDYLIYKRIMESPNPELRKEGWKLIRDVESQSRALVEAVKKAQAEGKDPLSAILILLETQ